MTRNIFEIEEEIQQYIEEWDNRDPSLDFFCINCDQVKNGGCWVFDSTECSVWPIDGKEHCRTDSFCVCSDCIDYMKTVMSESEIKTLRWEK